MLPAEVPMPSDPLISLVIPAYNCELHIGGSVSAALSQTYPNLEIIVVNDGSSDRTAQVLAGFGDMIRVIHQENQGVSAARNVGVAAAQGQYIAFGDADDVMLPGHIAAMMDTMRAAGPGKWWVVSQAYFLSAEGIDLERPVVVTTSLPPSKQRMAILQRNFGNMDALISADMHREIGGMDSDIDRSEDWDYWARALFNGWRAAFQPHPNVLYRWSDNSLSNDQDGLLAGEDILMDKLRREFWDVMTEEERAHLERRDQLGSPYRLSARANDALRARDYSTATALFAQAASLLPDDRRLQIKAKSMQWFRPSAAYWRKRRLRSDQLNRRYDFVPVGDEAAEAD